MNASTAKPRLASRWTVVAGLFAFGLVLTYLFWDDVHRFLRDEKNGTEVLALAAIAQVVFAVVLAALTLHSTRTTLRTQRLAIQPHIAFRDPVWDEKKEHVRVQLQNAGLGPAIGVNIEIASDSQDFSVAYPLSTVTIPPGTDLRAKIKCNYEDFSSAILPTQTQVNEDIDAFSVNVTYFDLYRQRHTSHATLRIRNGDNWFFVSEDSRG